MNELNRWRVQNERYLDAALDWLRLQLIWRILSERSAPETLSSTAVAIDNISEAEMAAAAAAMAQAEEMEPAPALILLGQQVGLSRFEQTVLLLCVAMESDMRVAELCTCIYPHQPYPTFALVLSLFEAPNWEALSPERPLRYWQLIEINQPGGQPFITSALRADERIVNYLKGLNYLDDRLAPFLVPLEIEAQQMALPPSQQETVETIARYLEQVSQAQTPPVIQLLGTDSLSKQWVAWHVAALLGLNLYRLPAELLPAQASELETLARLWQRESMLLPIVLYVDAQAVEGISLAGGQVSPLQRFLSRRPGLLFLGMRERWPHLGRTAIALEVGKPTPAEQQTLWAAILGSAAPESPALLAGQFNLNLPEIQHIARTALSEPTDGKRLTHDRLWDACLATTRPQLDILAQRLNPKATWDDLVLPDKASGLLHQMVDQMRQRSQVYEEWGFQRKMNRGLGVNALFAGDSGTGKTMAAEVIANDLRLNLYRIDLSAVVSKYIGETEKNLRRLFDAAEDGGAILFFDEADALFGKRSEVKDSHDRYANIEINYLLQRMEAYCGMAILATNLKNVLDKAFLRRLRFLIDFPFPGTAERKPIWQRAFPAGTPTDGLDYDWLARFNLTGGSVHNIALNAAFLAARAGTPVTMPLILNAIRTEFDKLDRPINETEFHNPVSLPAGESLV